MSNSQHYSAPRRLAAISTIAMAVAMICLGLAGSARAEFGVVPGSFTADVFSASSSVPETGAGVRPATATTSFEFNKTPDGLVLQGSARDVQLDIPPGLVGNPDAVPKCPRAEFDALIGTQADIQVGRCPVASQIGVVTLTIFLFGLTPVPIVAPVYNLVPKPGQVADFGFPILTVPVHVVASLDAARGYGLRISVTKISQGLPLGGSVMTLWGVPADRSHDGERACGGDGQITGGCSASVRREAFLTNPSSCAGPQTTRLSTDSWNAPGVFDHASFTTASGITGCDRVAFEPGADVALSTDRADAPAGLTADLSFAQNEDPDGLGNSPLRSAHVTLPEGVSINPGSADGLQACSDSQLGLGTDDAVACSEASKIGTVTAKTPLLDGQLTGSVFLRTQNSSDPESGEMFRLALVLAMPERGVLIKVPGSAKVDSRTGQITAEFLDNPQMPVSDLKMTLKSGPRSPLATSASCGQAAVNSRLSSWSGREEILSNPLMSACRPGLGGFTPSTDAGVSNPIGGASSPFALHITKPDGDSAVTGLSLTMPTGLLAGLKGNLGTQVGTAKAFVGPGSNPYVLPGQVFLEGRYGDAPFSLKVVVPAKAGPFDLGEVVVRQKVYVDPIDAHVTVVSDPLPTIVTGVPVRMQRLEVNVDKPGFMVNPTSCEAKKIGGTLSSAAGQPAAIDVRFQVSDCSSLALKPSLALSLSGKGQTRDGGHPAVSAVLTQPAGQANLKKVRVTLPLSLALDPDNSQSDGLCSFAEGSKPDPKCPASSVVGRATAVSPILNEPLSGPVYFVKNERKDPKSGRSIKTTPKLVIPLTGENGVKLTLTGASTVVNDQLVTTFDNIPDAPVSSFKMDINGGKKGILVVSAADICKSTQVAEQQIDGQNGKNADADVSIQTPSCPLKVLSKKVGKTSVAVKVSGLGAGKVTVSGKGIKKTSKAIASATVATITAKRTKGKPAKVTVSFDPAGPAKARKITK